jgi:molecular chaperone GrpE
VIKSLLPVIDDFDRAKKSMDTAADVEALKTGMDLVHSKFRNVLTEKGLTEMNPVGEAFDAEIHEAITHLPAPSEDQKGKVLDVIEKGYKLNDKIIRFPKVVIYS